MAQINIPEEHRTITDADQVRAFLASNGIEYEQTEPSVPVRADAPADELLAAYKPKIDELKARILGSAALEAVQVAAGVAHGAITVNGKLWDVTAPAAIVLEAGGLLSDFSGRPVFPFDLAHYGGAKVPFLAAAPQAHADSEHIVCEWLAGEDHFGGCLKFGPDGMLYFPVGDGSGYADGNQSGQDPLNFPIKTNNRLASLLRVAVSGEGRPTGNVETIFADLVQELKAETDRLDRVYTADLAAFNRMLERNRRDPIKP